MSIAANNVRLNDRSGAIDVGRDLPLPAPRTAIVCANNNDCIQQDAESYWDLDAYVCDPVEQVCIVDINSDGDGDGAPDWLEVVYGSNPADFDSKPASYAPRFDFDSVLRPSGDARDVGAFEYPQGN